MLSVALKMLLGDRGKYVGLLFGITFTAFLITFAASYFSGFMTRGFAVIAENPAIDIWVMDPAVESPEQTINIPGSVLYRVRGIEGVQFAVPLAVGTVDARLANGRVQPVQVIGVDDATLVGLPPLKHDVSPAVLRDPDAVVIDPGGTEGKLETPILPVDQWPYDGPRLGVPSRMLQAGDELLLNDHRVVVKGLSEALPRFPPRPLFYTTFSNAGRVLPPERHRLTFVLAVAAPGVAPDELANRIALRTGFKARTSDAFKADSVRWFLTNSEDVGDIGAMLVLAMAVGFGVSGVILYMFTTESLKQYAVLKTMGATSRLLLAMILTQVGVSALLGTGFGLGICAILGQLAADAGYPFRMMWYTPLVGTTMVFLVSIVAAMISVRPVLRLEPAVVFAGR